MQLELLSIFGGSFALALAGAMTPGTLLTVTVAESAKRGFMAGPWLIVGHGLLELSVVIAILKGLGGVLKNPGVIGAVALFGGIILLGMGFQMMRTAGKLSLSIDKKDSAQSIHPVLTGMLASLSNPYWTLWWATVGLGYLVSAAVWGMIGVVVFFVGHISADFLWFGFISFCVSKGQRFLNDRLYQWIIRCCAVLLAGFAFWFLHTGWATLVRG